MTFQDGCPHHWIPPGRMYFLNISITTGFVYPVITHWAWSEDGWLAKGININYEGEEVTIPYRASITLIVLKGTIAVQCTLQK